ncbi:HNH endonuclease signature motif containing protein [Belnapia sp. F-4-1]|uniref:HNH endonuclease signature motif containing protein n=1 Tax=Belnapia sp. F-4-1 TaxID=1545443 RepID=UPI0019176BF0|nr:HNH endonuclease signature motif containing protein [Belnapia sp. F-4-1]
MSRTNSATYDTRWRRLRNQHLSLKPLCVVCEQAGQLTVAQCVDHITPVAVASHRRLDPTNLRSLCSSHHAVITQHFKHTGINEMPI